MEIMSFFLRKLLTNSLFFPIGLSLKKHSLVATYKLVVIKSTYKVRILILCTKTKTIKQMKFLMISYQVLQSAELSHSLTRWQAWHLKKLDKSLSLSSDQSTELP